MSQNVVRQGYHSIMCRRSPACCVPGRVDRVTSNEAAVLKGTAAMTALMPKVRQKQMIDTTSDAEH